MACVWRTFFALELVLVGCATLPLKKIAHGVEKPYVSWIPSKVTRSDGLKTKDALQHNVMKLLSRGFYGIDITGHYYDLPLIANAISSSGIRRSSLFITSKISASSSESLGHGIDSMLSLMNTSFLDLLLLGGGQASGGCLHDCYEQWKTLEQYVNAGKVKAIGVSAFDTAQILEVMSGASIPPAVNQVEYNLLTQNDDTIKFCDAFNITVEAALPLEMEQWASDGQAVTAIAEKHGVSSAQVALRWISQRGHTAVLLPKTITGFSRDTDVWAFTLQDDEMETLTTLHETRSRLESRPQSRHWLEL